MTVTDVPFEPGPALVAGLAAAFITLLIIMVALAVAPVRFPLNPLYLVGSAVSIETTTAYVAGLVIILVTGAAYGLLVSAVFSGFQVTELEPLWGAVTGLFLSVITGTTLAYGRTLNRAVRAGQVGDPGPFLVRYGKLTAGEFIVAHMVFGLITAVIYIAMT